MPVAHVNQTELFHVEVGTGIPCLVMHGGLGLDHTHLHPWLDSLADLLKLVYYDHRGHGRSGRPPIETLTHEQFCRDANALRQHLGFNQTAVIGHSYGGFIALEYAVRYPEKLRYLILIDTAPAYKHGAEIRENLNRRQPTQAMQEALRAHPSSDSQLKRSFFTVLPLYFHRFDARLAHRLFGRTIWSASAAACNQRLLRSFDVRSQIGQITAPTLVVVGRDDFICPPSQARVLHKSIPNSELMVLQKSGHFPYVEEPEAFFEGVRNWIRKALESAE